MEWTLKSDRQILQTIGERLKEQRLAMNKSQEEMAEWSGISPASVRRIENGIAVNFAYFIKMLRALDMLEGLEFLLPPLPISPIKLKELNSRQRKRATGQRKR